MIELVMKLKGKEPYCYECQKYVPVVVAWWPASGHPLYTCLDCLKKALSLVAASEATWESLGQGIIDWPEPDQTHGAAD